MLIATTVVEIGTFKAYPALKINSAENFVMILMSFEAIEWSWEGKGTNLSRRKDSLKLPFPNMNFSWKFFVFMPMDSSVLMNDCLFWAGSSIFNSEMVQNNLYKYWNLEVTMHTYKSKVIFPSWLRLLPEDKIDWSEPNNLRFPV